MIREFYIQIFHGLMNNKSEKICSTKIPKIIHYCWFGRNPLPELAQKCIASWKKFCPDYKVKEWNEDNFDLDLYPYAREAYDHKKFAFVTDVVRLYALYNYGGIYMDTDVELVKNLDPILQYSGVSGFESTKCIPTGLMANCKHHPLVKEWLDDYDGLHFVKEDETLDLTTNVIRITNICQKYGFIPNGKMQTVSDFTFFPVEYFCPKNFLGELNITNNTYSIHHFNASWVDINKLSGISLIRKNHLDNWGLKLTPQEELMYSDILQYKILINNKTKLLTAANLMDRIFKVGHKHYKHNNMRVLTKYFLKQIAESGIQNNVTSLKLYFTTFRKWKIFETPRANLRYIYHCLRNLLHV